MILHIEAIVFAATQAVTIREIKVCLEKVFEKKVSKQEIAEMLDTLIEKYQNDEYSYELVKVSEGYLFLTKPLYHQSISYYLNQKAKRRLSNAAMETLSIIAYKQPITKAEMEQIRGVSCDYSVQKLLEKDLIAMKGRSEKPGRPMLYGTSDFCMNYFGLSSMKDLPKLKDIKIVETEIGKVE